MKVAVLKEMVAGEKRVAAVPPTVEKMVAAGMEVFVEAGAGLASGFANALGKFFPMLMTAAGTVLPAKVFVIGAGVAGLQAVATARRLGAVVSAFDIRPAVKEQVESLGARFVAVDLAEHAEDAKGYAK